MTGPLYRQQVPPGCPPGFPSRYTVRPGDTMFRIAQRYNVPLQALIDANPHIENPNLIFPGDVLCVPTLLISPCCLVLFPYTPRPPVLPVNASGTALIRRLTTGKDSVSILTVDLPRPAAFGNFDMYEGFLSIPYIGGFGFALFPTPEQAGVWAGTIEINQLLTPGTRIFVRTANSQTGVSGAPVLERLVAPCTLQP